VGLGFELSESFSGSWYRLEQPLGDLAIRLSLAWDVNGLREFLRDRRIEVGGRAFVEGLAERDPAGVPLAGAASMRLFDQKRIPYDFAFEADDGTTWRFRGQRDFFVHDLVDSLTILPASLYDPAGVESGRAVLRFDLRTELSPMMRSFRPRVRRARSPARG